MKSTRLLSLDAFRGYTVAAMILVNFPGDWDNVFPTLLHSDWNGLTFTDLVAPFFLFIVGVSIPFAYGGKLETGIAKGPLYRKIAWRSVKIFFVGMALNLIPLLEDPAQFDWAELRWTGTLHRIAIVFFASALIFLHTNWEKQAGIAASLLIGYWLAMTLIPTPGEGRVILEPGQNLAAWVDQVLLPGKMWQGTWDPEGILSTFPAVATALTGVLAGHVLRAELSPSFKANYLMAGGMLCAVAGYFWGLIFPVNENLWTSSFVLVTSGFASLCLGAVYFIADVTGYAGWTRAGVVFGANAISVYVLGDLLAIVCYHLPLAGGIGLNTFTTRALGAAGLSAPMASLLYALGYVAVLYLPAWLLYRRNIFIKL